MALSVGNMDLWQSWYGVAADVKPTAGVVVNDRFTETDTGAVYRWSGSAWVATGF